MEDITNQTFHDWTVLKFSGREEGWDWWQCQCSCGTIRDVRSHSLRYGKSKSCGCRKIKRHHPDAQIIQNEHGNPCMDLVGKKFRCLTVVSYSHNTPNRGEHWVCRCDCGNTVIVAGNDLKHDHAKISCGCIQSTTEQNIGERYGRLVIQKILPGAKRLCLCDCGNTKIALLSSMKWGRTLSCGCLRSESASKSGSLHGLQNVRGSTRYNWHVFVNNKTIRMRSGFEVIYAEYLIRNNMAFEYEPKIFQLASNIHYTPDFYLPDSSLWVEIKGNAKADWEQKKQLFEQVTGNTLLVITQSDLQHYLPGITYSAWMKHNAPKYRREQSLQHASPPELPPPAPPPVDRLRPGELVL